MPLAGGSAPNSYKKIVKTSKPWPELESTTSLETAVFRLDICFVTKILFPVVLYSVCNFRNFYLLVVRSAFVILIAKMHLCRSINLQKGYRSSYSCVDSIAG